MSPRTLKLGETKIHVLDDGTFITDASSLLGGNRKAKIRGAMRPVLVETGDALVLVDAGFGPELPESMRETHELRRDETLMDRLGETGHSAEDVTHVILSHLDPDHVGWALNPRGFPNATVYVQREALEEARNLPEDNERKEAVPAVERAVEEGWCQLLDGDEEILPGLKVEVRSGHAAGHQIVWIGTGEEVALFTADLAPAKIWLNPDLISGVDTDPEAARKNRTEILTEAERLGAPVILYHEPGDFLVTIRRKDGSFEAAPYEG